MNGQKKEQEIVSLRMLLLHNISKRNSFFICALSQDMKSAYSNEINGLAA